MAARSRTLASSLTLPGHGYPESRSNASAVTKRPRFPVRRAKLGKQRSAQQVQVLAPLAQRRQLQGEGRQAEVEVSPETPGGHRFVEVYRRRGE